MAFYFINNILSVSTVFLKYTFNRPTLQYKSIFNKINGTFFFTREYIPTQSNPMFHSFCAVGLYQIRNKNDLILIILIKYCNQLINTHQISHTSYNREEGEKTSMILLAFSLLFCTLTGRCVLPGQVCGTP